MCEVHTHVNLNLTGYTGNMCDKHRNPRWVWPQVPAQVKGSRMEEGVPVATPDSGHHASRVENRHSVM